MGGSARGHREVRGRADVWGRPSFPSFPVLSSQSQSTNAELSTGWARGQGSQKVIRRSLEGQVVTRGIRGRSAVPEPAPAAIFHTLSHLPLQSQSTNGKPRINQGWAGVVHGGQGKVMGSERRHRKVRGRADVTGTPSVAIFPDANIFTIMKSINKREIGLNIGHAGKGPRGHGEVEGSWGRSGVAHTSWERPLPPCFRFLTFFFYHHEVNQQTLTAGFRRRGDVTR